MVDSNVIAFVGNSAWSMYNFRRDVLLHFIQLGYSVVVLAPHDEYADAIQELGCRFYPVEFNNRTINPLKDLSLLNSLKAAYRDLRPGIVFHYVIKPNIYGTFAAAAVGVPSIAVVTGLGYVFAQRNWLFRLVKKLYWRAFSHSREVWFLNNSDASVFLSEKIVATQKLRVLPGEGINTEFFSRKQGPRSGRPFYFLMSARLLRSKGVAVYAAAARILKEKGLHCSFHLIGFFEKHHPDTITRSEIDQWEREGLLHYHGMARDVRQFLDQADCFVFPSYYHEGIPRSLMEASSMQLPVITTSIVGCRDIVVDEVTGLLCNPNDAAALVDKMERMMRFTEQERETMGRNGRLYVEEHFGIKKILAVYEETVKQATATPAVASEIT